MFGLDVTVDDDTRGLMEAIKKGNYQSLSHAAASIRKDVISTIEKSPYPSKPGTPIHTRKGLMRRAILYSVDRDAQEAVIGPRYSVVEESGEPHEKGVPYKGQRYPKRAFMLPGLLRSLPRLTAHWSGSIG